MAGVREARKAATRAKLVALATKAFRKEGYSDVNLRDIAKTAGMSTGAIFGHFTSKAGLFEACFDRPPPDVAAFLDHLSGRLKDGAAGTNGGWLEALADETDQLRRDLIGHHA